MTVHQSRVLVVLPDVHVGQLVERVLKLSGYDALLCSDKAGAQKVFKTSPPDMVILADKIGDDEGIALGEEMLQACPALPMMLLVGRETPEILKQALRHGFTEVLSLPLRSEDFIHTVKKILLAAQRRKESILSGAKRTTDDLIRRLDELETLTRQGHSITSTLDLDNILKVVVDSAVSLTDAEEGSLMLLDEATQELYVRAARNFPEEFVRTFRMPVKDTVAGEVLKDGKPFLLDENTPTKIKTSYLVYSLIYVPLQVEGRSIGILGVDNCQRQQAFGERDVRLLSTLAEYAAAAIENARLFSNTLQEHKRLEMLLDNIQNGVIMLDNEQCVVLANQAAMEVFHLEKDALGQSFRAVLHHPELLALIDAGTSGGRQTAELAVDDLILNARIAPVPQIGWVISFHDITHLKKLDQVKSEFVSIVSHDLRSPLTAIMGYVELLERAGPLNDLQRDFVRRVHVGVHNITSLVDDLLNLGRIEAGLDTLREKLDINSVLQALVDDLKIKMDEKGLVLVLDLSKEPLEVCANPIQIRQVFNNLIENAIKYTLPGGEIRIASGRQASQAIVAVSDTGIGIPPADLPHIFDKFYRASNIESSVVGTGLGLSIVRTVVERHGGRVWVDSTLGEGTTFTLLLPLDQQK